MLELPVPSPLLAGGLAFLLTAFFLLVPVRKYLGPRHRILEAVHPVAVAAVTLVIALAVLGLLYASLRTYSNPASAILLVVFVGLSAFPFLSTVTVSAREDPFTKTLRGYLEGGPADDEFRARLAMAASQDLPKDQDVLASHRDRLTRLLQVVGQNVAVPAGLSAEARIRYLQATIMRTVMQREGVHLPEPQVPGNLGPEEQAIYAWAATSKALRALPSHLALDDIRQSTELYKALGDLGEAGARLFDQQEELQRRQEKKHKERDKRPMSERIVEESLRDARSRVDAERRLEAEEKRIREDLRGKYSEDDIERIVQNARDTLKKRLDEMERNR